MHTTILHHTLHLSVHVPLPRSSVPTSYSHPLSSQLLTHGHLATKELSLYCLQLLDPKLFTYLQNTDTYKALSMLGHH